MKKILCGTDFSKAAGEAADVAAALALRSRGTLVLAHVFDEPGYESVPARLRGSLTAKLRKQLRGEADRLRERGVKVSEELLTGRPDEALVRLARELPARLIVVSSLGHRAPTRWLLGSVSERTAQSSPVPTLVVRSAAATPLLSGAGDAGKLRVVVGMDFTLASDAALEWVRDFQEVVPCDLTAAYVFRPPHEQERLGVGEADSPLQSLSGLRPVLERDVRERVIRLTGLQEFRVRIEAAWGHREMRLIEIAREEGAALIAVGTHQRQGVDRMWHGSMSRGVLHHADRSVVCVPAKMEPAGVPGPVPRIGRVLAATDFSRSGTLAVLHACALPGPGGLVRLVHVVHPRALPGGTYVQGPGRSEQHARFVRECQARLVGLIPSDAAARGIQVEVDVLEAVEPARAICQAARRMGADVICMGSHGATALSEALLGSVARSVMAGSRRPVLLVRPPRR